MSFAFEKMQLILLSDDFTTVTLYPKHETDFCITQVRNTLEYHYRFFFKAGQSCCFFFKYVGCFEHIYPDLCLLLGIYIAVVDLDGQISAITGAPKPE